MGMRVVREPRLRPVAVDELHPTQITVGMREVRAKLGNPDLPPPASTMVQIGALTREGALYEVEAVAVLPPT